MTDFNVLDTFVSIARFTADVQAAQTRIDSFFLNDCPVLEQRFQRWTTANVTIPTLEFAFAVLTWLIAQCDRTVEFKAIAALNVAAAMNATADAGLAITDTVSRFLEFIMYHGIDKKADQLWANKGAIALAAMDSVFGLDYRTM